MLGWTAITAIFVHVIGIEGLPLLFVGNALLVMLGSMVFSELIRFIRREFLIAVSLVIAAGILLVSTQMLLPRSEIAFLIGGVLGISLFLGQVGILMQLFIEDMFTPLESESAFPLIETAEVIGGIAAGVVLTTFGHTVAPHNFLYVIIIISLLIIPTVNYFQSKHENDLPKLNLKKKEKLKEISKLKRIEEGWEAIKYTGFLQGIVVVILCQFIIFNLVEFQYTKAVQQRVYQVQEATIAKETHASIQLNSTEFTHEKIQNDIVVSEVTFEKELAHTLGMFQMIFSIFALITQIFLASKVIRKLGIIQSMLIHPLLMVLNTIFMTMKFNLTSTAITKTGFEMTRTIFQSSYLSTYYAIKEETREQIKEFIEGIVVPLGAIIGTGFLFLFQAILTGSSITLGINITLIVIALVMTYVIYHLQNDYTKVNSDTLQLPENTPDKLNAIEILRQKGHNNSHEIFTKTLEKPFEASIVKIKILEALGESKKYNALPTIINALNDKNLEVQLAAVDALSRYKDISQHFYENAFARYRINKKLRELFEKDIYTETKIHIISILAKIEGRKTVEYLVGLLETADEKLKTDCVKVMSIFDDPNISHFIEKFLSSKNIILKCNTMRVLWKFEKYHEFIEANIEKMLDDLKETDYDLPAVIKLIGNLKLTEFKKELRKYAKSERFDVKETAIMSLVMMEDPESIKTFTKLILTNKHSGNKFKKFIESKHLSKKFQKQLKKVAHKKISMKINKIFTKNNGNILEEFNLKDLHELEFLYEMINKDREVLKISEIIEHK